MYNTEGPEILRLYNNRDNTEHHTFTDVLDSAYNNVQPSSCSGSARNSTIPCSSVPSSIPSNLSGPSTTHTKRELCLLSSEENMLSGDMQLDNKGTNVDYTDALLANCAQLPAPPMPSLSRVNPDPMVLEELPDTIST